MPAAEVLHDEVEFVDVIDHGPHRAVGEEREQLAAGEERDGIANAPAMGASVSAATLPDTSMSTSGKPSQRELST